MAHKKLFFAVKMFVIGMLLTVSAVAVILPITAICRGKPPEEDYFCIENYYTADGYGRYQKQISVLETVDEEGNVRENRPLKDTEIKSVGQSDLKNGQRMYNLSIELLVTYNSEKETYDIKSSAVWQDTNSGKSIGKAESKYFDYIGLAWKGGDRFCADDERIQGEYYDGKEVKLSRQSSDSYKGFVWQFKEKQNKSSVRCVNSSLSLKSVESTDDIRPTQVTMTYKHTYTAIKTTLLLNNGLNGSKSVIFTPIEKDWEIAISVLLPKN